MHECIYKWKHSCGTEKGLRLRDVHCKVLCLYSWILCADKLLIATQSGDVEQGDQPIPLFCIATNHTLPMDWTTSGMKGTRRLALVVLSSIPRETEYTSATFVFFVLVL